MQKVKIKSIKKINCTDRYDLNVPSTSNFFANNILIHNTSARFANQLLNRPKTFAERALSLLGFNIQTQSYGAIPGSRRTLKNERIDNGFYKKRNIWLDNMEKIQHVVPKNWVLYGELVGWAGDSLIQKGYTYGLKQGANNLYIYRIAIVNEDGHLFELSWDQVKEFCELNGLEYTPELWRGKHKDFQAEEWMDRRYFDEGFLNAVPLGDNNDLVDEGVCIRRDVEHLVLKAKAPKFLLHETKMLDS